MATNLREVRRGYADIGDGLQMYYETMGEGYPLILLHQSWWNSFEFEGVIPLLAKTYKVYAFDTLGFGFSPAAPEWWEFAEFTDSVVRAMDALMAGYGPERRPVPPGPIVIDPAQAASAFAASGMAAAYARAGQLDSAVAWSARLAAVRFYGTEGQVPAMAAALDLAQYAEAKGDDPAARAALSQFLARWKEGDPDLPSMAAARRALERLQATARR